MKISIRRLQPKVMPVVLITFIILFTASCMNNARAGAAVLESNDETDMMAYPEDAERAVFAGGCFWGVEYYMEQLEGVFSVESGYTGGHTENPSYSDVLSKTTGHVEAVEIVYDPSVISYRELAKVFFEIHDPTQTDGQGPDIGEQYLSVVFYNDASEKRTVEELITILEGEGFDVATTLEPASVFWPAENYHQDYYERKGSLPYCHGYVKRFPDEM